VLTSDNMTVSRENWNREELATEAQQAMGAETAVIVTLQKIGDIHSPRGIFVGVDP